MKSYLTSQRLAEALRDRLKYIKKEYAYNFDFVDENIKVIGASEYAQEKIQRIIVFPGVETFEKNLSVRAMKKEFLIEATVLAIDGQENWITAEKLKADLWDSLFLNHFLIVFDSGKMEPIPGEYIFNNEYGMISKVSFDGIWDGTATGNLWVRRLLNKFNSENQVDLVDVNFEIKLLNFINILSCIKVDNIDNPLNLGELNIFDFCDKINFVESRQEIVDESLGIVQVGMLVNCEYGIIGNNLYTIR